MKKAKLLLVCMCVGLSACSKSQEQWLSVADSSSNEADVLEKTDVYLVEPLKAVDQIASEEEEQNVIRLISQLSAEDFTAALAYDSNTVEFLVDNQVVLLFQSETDNTRIFGYQGTEYGNRGVIAYLNDKYSYFDFVWSGNSGEMEFYEQDFDHDGQSEIAFCFEGATGTGVEIYRLVMFDDVEGTGKLVAYEFTPEMQLEEFENKIQFVVDMETKKLNIAKDGVTEKTIDWERFEMEEEGDGFGIDCLNQITFDINEDGIKMHVGIGILINKAGPTIFFEDEEGELYLDVIYSDGKYEIN